jgi:hypothetical protein
MLRVSEVERRVVGEIEIADRLCAGHAERCSHLGGEEYTEQVKMFHTLLMSSGW